MNTFDQIVKAIQSGRSVTYCGDMVTLEGKYAWQDKRLWINHKHGSSILAGHREVCAMKITEE